LLAVIKSDEANEVLFARTFIEKKWQKKTSNDELIANVQLDALSPSSHFAFLFTRKDLTVLVGDLTNNGFLPISIRLGLS